MSVKVLLLIGSTFSFPRYSAPNLLVSRSAPRYWQPFPRSNRWDGAKCTSMTIGQLKWKKIAARVGNSRGNKCPQTIHTPANPRLKKKKQSRGSWHIASMFRRAYLSPSRLHPLHGAAHPGHTTTAFCSALVTLTKTQLRAATPVDVGDVDQSTWRAAELSANRLAASAVRPAPDSSDSKVDWRRAIPSFK